MNKAIFNIYIQIKIILRHIIMSRCVFNLKNKRRIFDKALIKQSNKQHGLIIIQQIVKISKA